MPLSVTQMLSLNGFLLSLLGFSIMLIFVYGTLRPCFGHPLGRDLRKQAIDRGLGTVVGRLFDCGDYPAAVPDPINADLIQGELYDLAIGHTLWAELDDYEDYRPHSDSQSLFERVQVVAFDAKRARCNAEIYWYRASVSGLDQIESGDYLEFCRR
jgi:gamma-glutamylcyclotransferase (GGCT)/AIG2-like uncharacterized protein YtfP